MSLGLDAGVVLEKLEQVFLEDYERVTGDKGERDAAEEEFTITSALRRLEKLKGREYVEKFCRELPLSF